MSNDQKKRLLDILEKNKERVIVLGKFLREQSGVVTIGETDVKVSVSGHNSGGLTGEEF